MSDALGSSLQPIQERLEQCLQQCENALAEGRIEHLQEAQAALWILFQNHQQTLDISLLTEFRERLQRLANRLRLMNNYWLNLLKHLSVSDTTTYHASSGYHLKHCPSLTFSTFYHKG